VSILVVIRNLQRIYIIPYEVLYICSIQIQQAHLKYRIIVNFGLRNIFIRMEVIIIRLEGTLKIEDIFSTMCFFFRYNRIMCMYNRTYICSRYRQHYHHHHSKNTYM